MRRHGTEDRILPYASTSKRLPTLIKDVRLVPIEAGPHNVGWTHPEVLNEEMLAFLNERACRTRVACCGRVAG